MNAKDYLKSQIESMFYLQDSVCKDITDETLMILPQGTVSPIGVIWLHIINGQDNFISIITNSNSLWKKDNWKKLFGSESAPNIGEDWSQYKELELKEELLRKYSDAVRERIKTVIKDIDSNSLDETVKFFTDSDPKSNVWVLMVGHTLLHCGEIAAIKGILGGKGLPF